MTFPTFLSVGKKKLKITRMRAGQYVDGRWQDGSSYVITICANVQPTLTGNDVKLLPEGDRTRKSLKLFSVSDIKMSEEGTALLKGDRFTWIDGDVYEIAATKQYVMGVLDHTVAIAVRQEIS